MLENRSNVGATIFAIYGPQAGQALITFDATIQENHEQRAQVTSHPVERGTDMTDHVHIQPREVRMTLLQSATPLVQSAEAGRVQDTHEALVAIQRSRLPVRLTTTLGDYLDVILTGYETVRNYKTSNMLEVELSFQQISMADIQRVAVPEQIRVPFKASGKDNTKNAKQTEKDATPAQEKQVKKSMLKNGVDGTINIVKSLTGA